MKQHGWFRMVSFVMALVSVLLAVQYLLYVIGYGWWLDRLLGIEGAVGLVEALHLMVGFFYLTTMVFLTEPKIAQEWVSVGIIMLFNLMSLVLFSGWRFGIEANFTSVLILSSVTYAFNTIITVDFLQGK